MTDVVPVKVRTGHGCDRCVYSINEHCNHPDKSNRICAKVNFAHKYEVIFTTPETAALMRLRGQTFEEN